MKNVKLKWIFLLFIFLSIKSFAQKPAFDHISIHVNNLDKSVAFYTEIFKLDSIPDPFPNYRVTWFKLGENAQFHVFEDKANIPKSKYHICFRVPSLLSFIKQLSSKGILYFNSSGEEKKITKRMDGVQQIYFYDPDGHKLEVNDAKF
jgi:lactoylglutathione lyase